ncbi:MAG: hypothetical protein H6697_09970 [Myxococcales bacterium]|nr:hypothetical protein [Myxococcales bacterium]
MNVTRPRYLSPLSDEFKAASRRLEEWRTTQFESMTLIVKQHISDPELTKHGGVRLRHSALVRRFALDAAPQYVMPVDRTFAGLDDVETATVRKLYDELGVDAFMQRLQARIAPQNSAIVALIPDLRDRRRGKLVSFLPYEYSRIHLGDAAEGDLRRAELVEVEYPFTEPLTEEERIRRGQEERVWIARLVLTPRLAFIEAPRSGKRYGIYTESQTHPFGRIPVLGIRLEDSPERGTWPPPVAGDVYSGQISVSVSGSDAEHQMRELSPGLQVLSGPGAAKLAKRVKKGPNNLLIIDASVNAGDGGPEFDYHQTNPDTERYQGVVDKGLSRLGTYRYQSPEGLRGDSGDAKEVERDEQNVERLRQERPWRVVEQQMYDLIADWHNITASRKLPAAVVTVAYHYPEPRRNDLQTRQARAIDYATGRRNPVDDVDTNGLDLTADEKKQKFDENVAAYLAWRRMLGDHVPTGLDAIAGFMGLGAPVAAAAPDGAATTPPDAIDQGEPPPDPAG